MFEKVLSLKIYGGAILALAIVSVVAVFSNYTRILECTMGVMFLVGITPVLLSLLPEKVSGANLELSGIEWATNLMVLVGLSLIAAGFFSSIFDLIFIGGLVTAPLLLTLVLAWLRDDHVLSRVLDVLFLVGEKLKLLKMRF